MYRCQKKIQSQRVNEHGEERKRDRKPSSSPSPGRIGEEVSSPDDNDDDAGLSGAS